MKKGAEINGVTISAGTGSFGKNDLSAIYGKKIRILIFPFQEPEAHYKGENYYFSELDTPGNKFWKIGRK